MRRLTIGSREIWVLPTPKIQAHVCAMEVAKAGWQSEGLFSVLLSGGNTPKTAYELIGSRYPLPWQRTHLFWADERLVPADDPESNYRSAVDSMIRFAPLRSNQIHRVRTELATPEAVAADYERELRNFARPIDLALLGIGEDGHTASLFPDVPIPDRWVIAPWISRLDSYRISVTPQVLNACRFLIVLVSGKSKAKALQAVLEGPRDPVSTPAQWIRSDRSLWLIDESAASRLDLSRAA